MISDICFNPKQPILDPLLKVLKTAVFESRCLAIMTSLIKITQVFLLLISSAFNTCTMSNCNQPHMLSNILINQEGLSVVLQSVGQELTGLWELVVQKRKEFFNWITNHCNHWTFMIWEKSRAPKENPQKHREIMIHRHLYLLINNKT